MKNFQFFLFASLLLALAVTSCTTYFKVPQPTGYTDLSEFPDEYVGTYQVDKNRLVISKIGFEFYTSSKRAKDVGISDSLFLRHLSPWHVLTNKSKYFDGGEGYQVAAFKLDENDPNILHALTLEGDEILQLLPNIAMQTEQHVISSTNGVNDPPEDVQIFDPTPAELLQIIEAKFVIRQQEKNYKGAMRIP